MTDNIFDAERNRRIQHLQQQSVSNVIRINPNLSSVLSRYEDAEMSRLKLLELQRLRNKKITAGEKALLKGIVKGRRAGGRGKKQKETKPAEPQKSQTQIEVEAEEKREKIKQESKKLAQQDRFLELEDFRQQREFIANERKIQLGDLRRQTEFISGQNRIAADQQIAVFNQGQANIRAGQSRQLEDRKLQAEIRDVRERVARDDAFRHAQLQEQQKLALEQLAAQRLENTQRAENERFKIQNQRAVDAERAITDREREQTLQATIDLVNRTQEAQEPPIGRGLSEEVGGLPTGRGLVEDVSLSESETSGSENIEQERVEAALERTASQRREDVERRGLRESSLTPSEQVAADQFFLQEVYSGSSVDPSVEGSQRSAEPDLQVASSNTSLHSEETAPATTLKETGVFKPKIKTLKEVREDNPVEEIRD